MQRLSRAIISGFLVAVMAFSMCVPALATDDYQSTATSWWNYLFHSLSKATDGLVFKDVLPVNKVVDLIGFAATDSVCNLSVDSFHHADSIANCETGSDKYGTYAITTCKYCGEKFKYYSSDLEKQYNDAVKDLPAKGYGSDGGLYVSPNHDCLSIDTTKGLYYCSHSSESKKLPSSIGTVTCSNPFVFKYASSSGGDSRWFYATYKFTCTIDGLYSWAPGYTATCSATTVSGTSASGTVSTSSSLTGSAVKYAGDTIAFSAKADFGYPRPYFISMTLNAPEPQLKVVPLESLNQYPVGSRPGAIIGDLSITNNNVTTKVENTSIINETNNTFYNPVTNNTYNMDGWTYDYSSRTYNFTINNVDNSVTYGDEYITIREGDTIYNIYYYINQDSGSGGDTPSTGCQHSYTSAITTAATCTTPGVETFTCSKCGQPVHPGHPRPWP